METNVNYTIVGFFVMILIAALTLSIIWLSSGFSIEHYKRYMVYMNDSVSGLSVDSPVEYNGVEVGSVVSITLNHDDPQVVEVLVDIRTGIPITTATIATLKTRGVTGITFMSLKDDDSPRKKLSVLRGQSYPIIRSGPSLFTRIDTALNQLTTNLHDVSIAIQRLLDNQNQHNIRQILINLDQITATLARNNGKMTIILNNTSTASAKLAELIQSGTNTMKSLETQTLPMTYNLLSNLDNMARNMTQITNELKQNPSIMIRGAAPAPLGPGESR